MKSHLQLKSLEQSIAVGRGRVSFKDLVPAGSIICPVNHTSDSILAVQIGLDGSNKTARRIYSGSVISMRSREER